MSTQHTPGPWAVGSKGGHIETANAWRMSIAICYNKESKADGVSKEEFEANARLIAAAPENYAWNKELAKIVRELCTAYGHPLPAASLDRSDAAIAKATGDKT